MPGGWTNSDRAARLPANWPALREYVRRRAGDQCEVIDNGHRCTRRGSDCDHIEAGDNHHPDNLRWTCRDHHKVKSSAEGIAARRARGGYLTNRRKPEPHPGLRR